MVAARPTSEHEPADQLLQHHCIEAIAQALEWSTQTGKPPRASSQKAQARDRHRAQPQRTPPPAFSRNITKSAA